MTFFGKELVHFIEAMGLQQEIVDSVYKFDFSETKGLAFIHSMSVSPGLPLLIRAFSYPSINAETVAALTLLRNGEEQATAVSEERSGCSACNMRVLSKLTSLYGLISVFVFLSVRLMCHASDQDILDRFPE